MWVCTRACSTALRLPFPFRQHARCVLSPLTNVVFKDARRAATHHPEPGMDCNSWKTMKYVGALPKIYFPSSKHCWALLVGQGRARARLQNRSGKRWNLRQPELTFHSATAVHFGEIGITRNCHQLMGLYAAKNGHGVLWRMYFSENSSEQCMAWCARTRNSFSDWL